MLGALAALAELPLERAVSMLAVSTGQAGEVAVDAELRSGPGGPGRRASTPASSYDRLRLPELPETRPGPSADRLGPVGRPATGRPRSLTTGSRRKRGWTGSAASPPSGRPASPTALPDKPGTLVVDMRSGAYSAAWKPKRATLRRRPRLQRDEGQAQTGEPHGEGGPRRSRPSAAGGEEAAPESPEAAATIARPRASPSS